jgi:hypothetical protein
MDSSFLSESESDQQKQAGIDLCQEMLWIISRLGPRARQYLITGDESWISPGAHQITKMREVRKYSNAVNRISIDLKGLSNCDWQLSHMIKKLATI